MLNDPFNRNRLPTDFSREGRVMLLKQAFAALLRGEMPSMEARMFLAGGGAAWLEEGGDIARDFWRVTAPRGSHRRPEVVARELASSSLPMNDGAHANLETEIPQLNPHSHASSLQRDHCQEPEGGQAPSGRLGHHTDH